MFKVKVNLNLPSNGINKKFWYVISTENDNSTTTADLINYICQNFNLDASELQSSCSVELEDFELLRDTSLNQILKEGDQLVVKQSTNQLNSSQFINFPNFSTISPIKSSSTFIGASSPQNKTLPAFKFHGPQGDTLIKQLLPNSKLKFDQNLTKAQRTNLKKRLKQKLIREDINNTSKKLRLNNDISSISLNNGGGEVVEGNSLDFYSNLVDESIEDMSKMTPVKVKKDRKDKKEKKDKSKKFDKPKSKENTNQSEQDIEDQTQYCAPKSVDSVNNKSKKENHKQKESDNEHTENYENPHANDVTLPLSYTNNVLVDEEIIRSHVKDSITQASNQPEVTESTNGTTNSKQKSHTEALISSAELDKLPSVNTSEWTPIPQTRIAYKEWTITEGGCPGLSDYKQATIISFMPSTDEITVKLVNSEHDTDHNNEESYDEASDYDFNRKQRQRVFTEEGIEIEYITEADKIDQVIWKGSLVELKVIQ